MNPECYLQFRILQLYLNKQPRKQKHKEPKMANVFRRPSAIQAFQIWIIVLTKLTAIILSSSAFLGIGIICGKSKIFNWHVRDND